MPGILPMKVIKVGTGTQSRIAQACDRCRSKKIRCDGITPCCSQCATVGFECKTSDKLSRRAFPRGYTESLEERVRALEGEVKELKDLLDEKDEKIDILSRIRSSSPQKPAPPTLSPAPASESKVTVPHKKDDTFKLQQSSFLVTDEKIRPYFTGASSGRAFFDTLKGKIQECGKPCANLNSKSFFSSAITIPQDLGYSSVCTPSNNVLPRLISDQLINIFFQEWAPLFPILHRPTFLKLYTDYTTDPENIKDKQAIVQLHLVFSIAGLFIENNKEIVSNCESQWRLALDSLLSDNSIATLQSLVLAQLYCICKADYNQILRYRGVAVAFAHRLGLHQSQKRFSLGALSRETRKKVFWSLYTLDCFAAAILGLPRLLKDEDIHTEYPSDVDDENVTERGFQSTLPGESTRVSSALALFRVARIIANVLGEVYPSASAHDISLERISSLSDELDAWRDGLASHLRLEFTQDKPSTNVVSSRSPLLSLAYYYIRMLIHRPVVTSNLGPKASMSLVVLGDSSKHIVQIAQLLEERHMSFSMCLNKSELILLAGFSLLYHGLNLKQEGKLIQDNQKIVRSAVEILERSHSQSATAFKKVATTMIANDHLAKPVSTNENQATQHNKSSDNMPALQIENKTRKQSVQVTHSHISFRANRAKKQECINFRRSSIPNLAINGSVPYSPSIDSPSIYQSSLASTQSDSTTERTHSDAYLLRPRILSPSGSSLPNLDYLSFGDDPQTLPTYPINTKSPREVSEWEHVLGYIDMTSSPSHENYYDSYVDSSSNPASIISSRLETSTSLGMHNWLPEVCGELDSLPVAAPAQAQSVFSLSEESLTSGDDLSSCELGAEYRGILMPNLEGFEGLDELDGSFGL